MICLLRDGDYMGSSGIYKQLQDIKQDVGKIANKIARGVAQKALEDMQAVHSMIMIQYYNGYSPIRTYTYISPKTGLEHKASGYRRTGNLGANSIIPKGVTQIGEHGFKAAVQIGSSGMSDYTNNMGRTFPASGVFDLVWNMGNRGLPPDYPGHVELFSVGLNYNGISMSGTPDNAMNEFMNQWWDIIGSVESDKIAHSV